MKTEYRDSITKNKEYVSYHITSHYSETIVIVSKVDIYQLVAEAVAEFVKTNPRFKTLQHDTNFRALLDTQHHVASGKVGAVLKVPSIEMKNARNILQRMVVAFKSFYEKIVKDPYYPKWYERGLAHMAHIKVRYSSDSLSASR